MRRRVKKKPELSLRARALQSLARREYSRAELRSKLLPHVSRDEFNEATQPLELDSLLDDLIARGWLSDERAATQFVHSKRSRFGAQRITHELRQKGIAENFIAEALPNLQETELDTAIDVWRRKFGTIALDAKAKAKQMRFLQSRGFSIDIILKVLRKAELNE